MRLVVLAVVFAVACSRSTPGPDAEPTAPSPVADDTSTSAPADATPPPAEPVTPPAPTSPIAVTPRFELPLPLSPKERSVAAISRDGTRLAVGYAEHVALFDAATGEALWRVPAMGPGALGFSPSGAWLWVVSIDGLARLATATGISDWSAEGGPIEQVFVPTSDEGGLAFGSPNAVITLPRTVQPFELGVDVADASFDPAAARVARFDADANRVIVASDSHTLLLGRSGQHLAFMGRPEDLPDGAPESSSPGPTADTRITFEEAEVHLIDAKTWTTKAQAIMPRAEDGSVIADWILVATHPSGPRAAFLGPDQTVVVDFGKKRVVSTIPRGVGRPDEPWPAFFVADGNELWLIDDEPARWRLTDKALLLVAAEADAQVLLTDHALLLGAHRVSARDVDGKVTWVTHAPGDVTWEGGAVGGGRVARAVRKQMDDAHPVIGVQLFDAATGALQELLAASGTLGEDDATVAIDAQRVVVATSERLVVWPLPAGAPIESPLAGGRARGVSTAGLIIQRDGKLEAVTIGADGRPGAARAIDLTVPADAPMSVVGATALVGGEGKVHVIDIAAGKLVRSVPVDAADVAGLAADARVTRVAVRTKAGDTSVHDAVTGARYFTPQQGSAAWSVALSDDGARLVTAGALMRLYDLMVPAADAASPTAIAGYLAPVMRDGAVVKVRWSATATVIDTDTGAETKTPSKGEGRCKISAAGEAFAMACEGIDIKSDYEVKPPSSFERDGDVVKTDAGWRLPIVPRETMHLELGRSDDPDRAVTASQRFGRDGDRWCFEKRQGVAHEGVERLCFFAEGGLASYEVEEGSAAIGIEARIDFEGSSGFASPALSTKPDEPEAPSPGGTRAVPAVIEPMTPGELPLLERLDKEIGAGRPVAILPWHAGLVAASADGARWRRLVAGSVSWAIVDERAQVVWLAREVMVGEQTTRELWVLDLLGTSLEPVKVTGGLPDVDIQIRYGTAEAGELLRARASEGELAVVVMDPARPRIESAGGVYREVGLTDKEAAEKAIAAAQPDGKAKELLTRLAERGRDRHIEPPAATVALPERVAVPEEACEEAKVCGLVSAFKGTPYWLVVIAHSCGDACHVTKNLYDPARKVFLALDAQGTTSTKPIGDHAAVGSALVARDGSAFIMGGALHAIGQAALVERVPDGVSHAGVGGGFIGGQWFVE